MAALDPSRLGIEMQSIGFDSERKEYVLRADASELNAAIGRLVAAIDEVHDAYAALPEGIRDRLAGSTLILGSK